MGKHVVWVGLVLAGVIPFLGGCKEKAEQAPPKPEPAKDAVVMPGQNQPPKKAPPRRPPPPPNRPQ